jgi:hypothetical protein
MAMLLTTFYMSNMLKHRNIDAAAIRNLVKEDAGAAKVSQNLVDIYNMLDATIKPFFITGKKLRGDDLRTMFNECCTRFLQMCTPVDEDRSFREATRTKPKGEVYQARFVSFKRIEASLNDTEQYQLFNFRIYASRKYVVLDFQEQPFAFQYHTAERLLERGTEKKDSLYQLASSVYRYAAFILAIKRFASDKLDSRLVLPLAGATGVLLGDFIDRSVYSGKRRQYNHTSCVEREQLVANFDFCFLARTFVSNGMLGDDQRELMHSIEEWRHKFDNQNIAAIRDHFWRSDMREDRVDWSGIDDETYDALEAVLGTEAVIRTITG